MAQEKLSQETVLTIFGDAAAALPKLAEDRDAHKARADAAEAKLASYERRDTVQKIAYAMTEKGLDGGASHQELCERLEVWAQQGKLAEVQRAVELAGPDMGQKIAQVYDGGGGVGGGSYEPGMDPGTSGSGSDFMRYLLDGNT